MHIVSRSVLVAFYSRPAFKDAKGALEAWYDVARQAKWASPAAVKAQYRNASVITNNRVVFNFKGNDYQLIVSFAYRMQRAYIKFIGTHAQYDQVDATAIDQSQPKE
jgi:mRNA interferase HigB